MSYRLVILGVLAEQSHYGYDLKQTIERQHYADYIRLSGGGLYYHLRKLREEGYIEEQMVEREGKYPDRHIYRITASGRLYLLELLRSTLDDVAGRRVYDPLDAAFSFAFLLPSTEVQARLQHQLDMARGQLSTLEVLQLFHQRVIEPSTAEYDKRIARESFYAQLMIDHNVALLRHEVSWLQEAICRIEVQRDLEQQDAQPSSSEPSITEKYTAFEDAHAQMVGILAAYNHEVDLAWQEYCRQAPTLPDGELLQAYQQRVTDARHAYEAAVSHVLDDKH